MLIQLGDIDGAITIIVCLGLLVAACAPALCDGEAAGETDAGSINDASLQIIKQDDAPADVEGQGGEPDESGDEAADAAPSEALPMGEGREGSDVDAGGEERPSDANGADQTEDHGSGLRLPADPSQSETSDDERVRVIADEALVEEGVILAEGNVEVRGSDFEADADSAVVDEDRIWVRLVGNVVINTENIETTATNLRVNVETGKWAASHGRSQIQPQFFQGGIREPVYVTASKLGVREETDAIDAHGASATTCSKRHPHFALRSDHVTAVPGERVVFEKPSLYLFGNRIIKYPLDFVLSLRHRRSRLIPEIGENQVEGKYLKFAYPYEMDRQNTGLLRLHLTEKRGTGYGFEHYLETRRHSGELSFFYEPSQDAISSSLNHRWWLSEQDTWTSRTEYQRNSGYYGTRDTFLADWEARHRSRDTNASLGFRYSASGSEGSKSRRFTTAYSHRKSIGNDANWDLRMRMRRSKSRPGQAADEELDASFEYDQRRDKYDWSFLVDNRFDLDRSAYEGDSSYRAINRLPQVTLQTDSDRLNWDPVLGMPVRARVELEHLQQDPEDVSVSRAGIKFDASGMRQRLSGDTTLRTSARYWQSFYDEGSAAYLAGLNAELRQNAGQHWTSRWNLNYSSFAGYSPVRTDYWGRDKDASFELVHLVPDSSRFSLSGGYDFISDRWRTALADFEVMTSDSSKLSLDTGYDIENSNWRPLRGRWVFARPERLYLALGTQYDIEESKLRQGSVNLDWRMDRRTRLEFIGRYSGLTHKLSQMDVRLTRDMHCWMGSVSYNKPSGNWQVTLWLKAFEAAQLNFGSARGARAQSGAGMYY